MVGHESQIEAVETHEAQFSEKNPWEAFIKVDMGSHRAGVETHAPRLKSLIGRAEKSSAVKIYGFYCHAGHSYGGRSVEAAAEILNEKVEAALHAASLVVSLDPLVLSIGATPTAYVISKLDQSLRQSQHKIELHGGLSFSYPDIPKSGFSVATDRR